MKAGFGTLAVSGGSILFSISAHDVPGVLESTADLRARTKSNCEVSSVASSVQYTDESSYGSGTSLSASGSMTSQEVHHTLPSATEKRNPPLPEWDSGEI